MLTGDYLVGFAIFWLGFFFMTLLPLTLELSAESVDKKYLGSANALLWEFSQIGSIAFIVLYEFIGTGQNWSLTLVFSGLVTLASVPLVFLLKEKLVGAPATKN